MNYFVVIILVVLCVSLWKLLILKKKLQVCKSKERLDLEKIEKLVAQRTTELTELTRHLLNAREDERSRLARNLHDELGALLTSAKLDAARIKSRLLDTAPEALLLLKHLVETLNSSIALGRDIIEDLRPSSLSHLGLVATIEILLREFSESTGVEVHSELEPVSLSVTMELTLYRLVQEAMTNISKYARATHVWVNLTQREGQVEVRIWDDGIGFDTTAPLYSAYGLAGMRFRVEDEGGRMTLESAPGKGTQIMAVLQQGQTL